MSPEVCIYCQVHQPFRVRRYRVFDVGTGRGWFDDERNAAIVRRVADRCYVPATRLLADAVRRSGGRFKLALSLTGTVLEQLSTWAPDALASFQELVATGHAEVLGETHYHSLSALADPQEFTTQVTLHRDAIARVFGRRPTVFRNTELIYDDAIGPLVARLGYRAALVEGADRVLGWRSANYVYEAGIGARAPAAAPELPPERRRRIPLLEPELGRLAAHGRQVRGVARVERRLERAPVRGLRDLRRAPVGRHRHLRLPAPAAGGARPPRDPCVLPSELAERPPVAPLSFPVPTSWADVGRDTSAWLGNRMQRAAHERLYRIGHAVIASGDAEKIAGWRKLTTSDHCYYMCTKWFADGDVHKYFNPYDSPYDAFVAFMNVLTDLEQSLPAAPAWRDRGWAEGREMAVFA